MRRYPIGGLLGLTALLSLSSAASAQAPGSITFYSQTNFTGLSFTVDSSRSDLRLVWPVRSVRVGRGPGWQVCTRTQFRDCRFFDQHQGDVRLVVRSVERMAEPLPGPVPPGRPGMSLRGMASEYFPAPADARGRVISCASGAANCARESADRFCRSRGWNYASFSLQETVNRQNFLADVLCTRSRN